MHFSPGALFVQYKISILMANVLRFTLKKNMMISSPDQTPHLTGFNYFLELLAAVNSQLNN